MDKQVKDFLDGLRNKGFNDAQIQHLSSFTKSKKAWIEEAKRMNKSNANRAAASMGPLKGAVKRRVNGGRGNPNYKSTLSQSTNGGEGIARAVGDMFSKKNPKSAPNAAAHGADKIVNTAKGFAKGLGKRDQKVRKKIEKDVLSKAALRRRMLAKGK